MTDPVDPARGPTRRAVLGLGAIAAGVAGGAFAWSRLRPIEFEAINGLPGFRRLKGISQVTSGSFATFGLGDTGPDIDIAARDAARSQIDADPMRALHGPGPYAGVPIAFFTAGGCPLCAPQADRLAGLAPNISLRPLALFGAESDRAARAMIAAGSDAWALHDRLVGTSFRTEDPFIRTVSETALGPARTDTIMSDLDTSRVDAELARNHALTLRLGIVGTPAAVIGRTLVVGTTPRPVLERILRDEESLL